MDIHRTKLYPQLLAKSQNLHQSNKDEEKCKAMNVREMAMKAKEVQALARYASL